MRVLPIMDHRFIHITCFLQTGFLVYGLWFTRKLFWVLCGAPDHINQPEQWTVTVRPQLLLEYWSIFEQVFLRQHKVIIGHWCTLGWNCSPTNFMTSLWWNHQIYKQHQNRQNIQEQCISTKWSGMVLARITWCENRFNKGVDVQRWHPVLAWITHDIPTT